MSESQGQGRAADPQEKPLNEQSPSEKLREETPTAASVPGAENPESEEIKQEINPNTE